MTADLRLTLRHRLRATLKDVLPEHAPVALVGFPNHSNPGDAAIWLGELNYLHHQGHAIEYVCDVLSYERDHLARRAPDAVVLLHGGGNLGDLWPDHQVLRERVVLDFPSRKIVQLPQTMSFAQTRSLDRARRAFGHHPDLTLLLRDRHSLDQARAAFDCRSLVAPDCAFMLGPLDRTGTPDADVIWLSRADAEARQGERARSRRGVEVVDWLSDGAADRGWSGAEWRRRLVTRRGGRVVHRAPRATDPLAGLLWRLYDRHAVQRTQYGRRLLSRGRGVVTDRLHGHILSMLMGIPHVVLDNSYGKNSAFHDTWTREWPLARLSASPAAALDDLQTLDAREPGTHR